MSCPSEPPASPLSCLCACARRYDGEVFVKPPEVLMRDRLLGSYEVGCLGTWRGALGRLWEQRKEGSGALEQQPGARMCKRVHV